MTLNGGFDVSVDNVGRKGVRQKAEEYNNTKAYARNGEASL
jgi:hypothetical protein